MRFEPLTLDLIAGQTRSYSSIQFVRAQGGYWSAECFGLDAFSDLGKTANVGSTMPPLLVIDDDADAHFLLGRCLIQAGIQCDLHTARDAEAGIEYFEKCVRGELVWPYVVFLDIRMPRADGFSVLEWLRQRSLLGNTLVAMMSSSDLPRDVSRSFSLGAHTYLNKAVRPEVLGPIVKSAIALAEQHRTPQSK